VTHDPMRAALEPFAKAYETVTSNEAVRHYSLAQIAAICACEIAGVHYQRAFQAIASTPPTPTDDLALKLERGGEINTMQRDDIWKLHDLIKHGAKIIDIRVRKDAREYLFEADWLKSMLRAVLGMADAGERQRP